MKRSILLICLILSLLLCGCGAVTEVEEAITAIGTVTPDSLDEIEAAQALLNELTEKQLAKVENLDVLTAARTEYERQTGLIEDAKATISAIGTVTPDSGAAIQKAREAYDVLAQEQLTDYVSGEYPTLTDAESVYEDMTQLLAYVRSTVEKIGTVTLESSDAINNAHYAVTDAINAGLGDYIEEDVSTLLGKQLEYAALEEAHFYDSAITCFKSGEYFEGNEFVEKLKLYYGNSPRANEVCAAAVDIMVGHANQYIRDGALEKASNTLTTCSLYFEEYCSANDAYTTASSSLEQKLEKLRPANGKVIHNGVGSGYSKLHVSASANDALIKLESTTNPDKYMLFFVRANETATMSVKEGEYIIKYTTGLTWYGTEEMFGSTASFTQADDIFKFTVTYSGNYVYYSNISITLYTVFGGNLQTDPISAADF